MNITHQIIVKHLQQKETAEEQKVLEQWLQESPKNQQLLDEFKSVWLNGSASDQNQVFNSSETWSQIEESIVPQETNVRKLWEYRWFKVAASVVLLLGAALILNQYTESNKTIEYADLIEVEAGDDMRSVTLPDGSQVTLMSGSSIAYKNSFSDLRYVKLVGGAHFDVVSGDTEFSVKSNETTVTVLGTQFFVNEVSDGTIVYVEEGEVAVKNSSVADLPTLKENQAIRINQLVGTVEAIEQTSNLTAWKTGVLSFEDIRLSEVIKDVSDYYKVDLRLKSSSIGDCHITTRFDNKSLSEVLEVIEIVLDVEIAQTDTKEYSISGRGC